MSGNIPYIVVWMNEDKTDHWDVFFSFEDAEKKYVELIKDDAQIYVHLCLPFRSTDHNTITVWA